MMIKRNFIVRYDKTANRACIRRHRDIMQNDPVDNPLAQGPGAQDQDSNRQPSMPPP
jgi:hypothetical protein